MATAQLLHAFSVRSEKATFFDRTPVPPNPYIPMSVGGGIGLTLLMQLVPGARRVFEVLDAPEGVADRPGAVDLVELRGQVQLDHVSFRYPKATDVSVGSLESPVRTTRIFCHSTSLSFARSSVCASTGVTNAEPKCGFASSV